MIQLKYHAIGQQSDLSVSYEITDQNDKPLGTVEGYLNEYGDLISVVKILEDFQKKGIGFSAFKKIFDDLNNKLPIQRIIASWNADEEFNYNEDGISTNLRLFRKCLSERNDQKNCAFKTPTGKWALKLGFDQCSISKIGSDSVSVVFSRK